MENPSNGQAGTLEQGLDFWARQEQKFRELFSAEALKDREFLQMKLRYYDSLWYRHSRASLDTEGQLMRNMLRFQRRKIERSLYPGLLDRLIRKADTAIQSTWMRSRQKAEQKRNSLEGYLYNSPRPSERQQSASPAQQPEKQNEQHRMQQSRQPYGYTFNKSYRKKAKKGMRL